MNRIKFAARSLLTNSFSLTEREADRLHCQVGFVADETKPENIAALMAQLRPMALAHMPTIRFGPEQDGGYLVPDDLDGISACFSPGVSDVSGFELDCAERGMEVFLADASVDGPAVSHPRFHFLKKYVGASNHGEIMTLESWLQTSLPASTDDLLLQMDIEGAEYETLLATPAWLLSRFRIIVMEFHDLDHLWCRPFFNVAAATFRKLLATHVCHHIHPNNFCDNFEKHGIELPPLCEFTFVRRDRMSGCAPNQHVPHPLDRDNAPARNRLALDRLWFAAAKR